LDGDTVKILSPAIVLNEPAIDISTYNAGIVFDGSIWINEDRLINGEMTEFKSKSWAAGRELLKDPRIFKMCTDQIKLSVFKIASNLHLMVKDVEITFAAE